MIQCILVNLGLKWFGFEITTNALGSITRRCSGNKCPGSLFMDQSELQKLAVSVSDIKTLIKNFKFLLIFLYELLMSF